MNEFDNKASEWDKNPIHHERSAAIAKRLTEMAIIGHGMKALEYGAGTGILSFLLADRFSEITLMDSSPEMVKMITEKLSGSKTKNLFPLHHDLEQDEYNGDNFDFIFTQMVLHHVNDTTLLFEKFHSILNQGGYLAIADLYPEDGSFHGENFSGHKGFDVLDLQEELEEIGFSKITAEHCYTIKRPVGNSLKEYPVFLMIAQR
jgi:tRNA (cmo5U34)-methyltransferase